jgi:hypothetical protein
MPGKMTPGFDEAEYLALLTTFPPRVSESEEQHDTMLAEIDRLLRIPDRTPAQQAYLDVLSTLAADWEDENIWGLAYFAGTGCWASFASRRRSPARSGNASASGTRMSTPTARNWKTWRKPSPSSGNWLTASTMPET